MPSLSVSLLGTFQVVLGNEQVVTFGYDKVRALLAYLAVESDIPHRRESLCALFWPDQTPKSARHSLSQAILKLRQALQYQKSTPPRLTADRETVQFNLRADDYLDVSAFDAHLDAHDRHPHAKPEQCEECVQQMEAAIALYKGEFLGGLMLDGSAAFEDWVIIQREQRHRRTLDALHILTTHYLHRGRYRLAQKYARLQVEMEPYREEAYRALMQALVSSGQRSAALAQYENCKKKLAEELGVEPTEETQALYNRIRQAGESRPNNLPTQLMSLIGRKREVMEISEKLADPNCRLLTLAGIGGIGKTTLALRASHACLGNFLHGTYWIPLAQLHAPEQIPASIVDALPITLGSDPEAQLFDYLRDRSILLVLDNFEHLIQAELRGADMATRFLNKILHDAPHVKMLTTSRERLNLRAEWVIQMEGLTHPVDFSVENAETLPQYAAIQLFEQRARQVVAGFPSLPDARRQEAYPQIARICKLLHGIPLGIELAAGWVDQFTCQEIADKIGADLDFLTTSLRDIPDRHHSLRAVFDHSWELLLAEEQSILRKLSVFQGTFTRSTARVITGAAPHQLSGLVNKSFLQEEISERYSMHPLLQQFLVPELSADPIEDQHTRQIHATYYADFLKEREYALTVQALAAPLKEVEAEIADIRAAWDWAIVKKDSDIIDKASRGLFIYYWSRNQYEEGKNIFVVAANIVEMLDESPQNQLLLIQIRTRIAEFLFWLGDLSKAEEILLENIETLRSQDIQSELSVTMELLSRVYIWQGEYGKAKELANEAIELARVAGERHSLAQALGTLASAICDDSADFEEANLLYEESLALYQQIGNPFGIAKVLVNQGASFYAQGDFPRAQYLYQQSLERYRALDYTYGISVCLNNLAVTARKLGNFENARSLIEESLAQKRETGNRMAILHSLLEIGKLNFETKNYTDAYNYYCEALQIALNNQYTTFLGSIMLGFAELWSTSGDKLQAAELAAWVLAQENFDLQTNALAKEFYTELTQALSVYDVQKCEERGSRKQVEDWATMIFG